MVIHLMSAKDMYIKDFDDDVKCGRLRSLQSNCNYGALRMIAAIAAGVSLAACMLSPPDPLALVPPNARVVVLADWPAITRSEYLRRVLATDSLQTQLGALGVEAANIRQIVAFQLESFDVNESAVVVSGSFEHGTVEMRQEHDPAGRIVQQLRPDRVVVGTRHAVEEASTFLRSTRAGSSSENAAARRLFAALPHGAPFQAVFVVAGMARDAASFAFDTSLSILEFTRVGPVAKILGRLGVPRGLACAVRPTSTTLRR